MKFRCTSASTRDVDERLLAAVTIGLEHQLSLKMRSAAFGIGFNRFMVVVVVANDRELSEKLQRQFHRATRYKDHITGESVRLLSIAVPIDPDDVARLTLDALR